MAKKKSKLFDIKNVLTTLKAMVVGIVAGLPLVLIQLGRTTYPTIMMVLGGLYVIFYLFFWGFLAKKYWSWK